MTSKRQQIPLSLELPPSWAGEDFFISPSNQIAIDMIKSWPDWPAMGAIIIGPYGSGKTHLANIWAKKAAAKYWPEEGDIVVVDGLTAELDQTALFHLFNRLKEAKGALLITAEQPINQLGLTLPDLVSRLQSLPTATIDQPDEHLMSALLMKQFADKQLKVGMDVIRFMVLRLERTYENIKTVVEQLDQAALGEKKPITVPFVRRVLDLADEAKASE